MKTILYISLFFVIQLKAQINYTSKSIDSINHKRICPLIKEELVKQNIIFYNDSDLFKILNSDSLNIFKNYSVCFDCMFELGLDLNKPLPKPLPRNSRLSMEYTIIKEGLDPDKNKKVGKSVIDPYDLFQLFVNIKKYYEMNYCNLATKKDISNLVENSLLSYPLSVKNVLLCKYKHITKEKMYKDIRLHNSKK